MNFAVIQIGCFLKTQGYCPGTGVVIGAARLLQ